MTMPSRLRLGNWPNAVFALALALSVGGCALAPFAEDGLFRQATTAVGATGRLQEPAPFVKESRPAEQDYVPVGVTPKRSVDPRAPGGVSQLEQELRAKQAGSVQQATRPVPPSPYDGKIEPGFKPPPPAPLPEGKAPDLGLRGPQAAPAPVSAPPRPAASRTPANRNTPKKKTQEGADSH
jgi:hypothetical protein